MKLFGYRFTKESPSLEANQITALNVRLKREQRERARDAEQNAAILKAEQALAAKAKKEQALALTKIVAEQATRKSYDKRNRARAAIINLEQVERYAAMKEREGVSPQRKAALDAIIVSRIEAVKAMGFNLSNMSNPLKELQRTASGN